ncbi:MAG: phosphoribosylglycinamide formyltransferase [Bacteroidaceae bacterium]|nr:phosphoribosylglycinamide formyltransferase [Bacteroidaceae bacterium]
MKNIAILASGTGTNAENIIKYFKDSDKVNVAFVLVDNPTAQARERARNLGVPTYIRMKHEFKEPTLILPLLDLYHIDLLVLAGSLIFLPEYLTSRYDHRIINIHPSLLPKYGGKGFYGHKVHEAAIASGDKESGITIHYVNNEYDSGDIIFRATCPILPDDTADTLAERVHALEYQHFPHVIEEVSLQIK